MFRYTPAISNHSNILDCFKTKGDLDCNMHMIYDDEVKESFVYVYIVHVKQV